jgi:hypothetical protein
MSPKKPLFKYSSPVSKKYDNIGRINNVLKPQKKSRARSNKDTKEYDSDDTFIQRPRINFKKSHSIGYSDMKLIRRSRY